MHGTRPPEEDTDIESGMFITLHPGHLVYEDEDPYISTRLARRKAALHSQTPSDSALLDSEQHHAQKARLTDYVPNLGYFAAGGLSGITSRTATAPLDRLKVYLIAQTGTATEAVKAAKRGAAVEATKHGMSTLWNGCKDLWAAGGVRSLFAGTHIRQSLNWSWQNANMARQRVECYQGCARVRCQVRLLRGTLPYYDCSFNSLASRLV